MPKAPRRPRDLPQPDLWLSCRDLSPWSEDIPRDVTAIMNAARAAEWDTVSHLIDNNDRGMCLANCWRPGGTSEFTPLHHAAWHGHTEAVDALIRLGAWRLMRNAAGELPADVARRRGHVSLAERLAPPPEIAHARQAVRSQQHFFNALVHVRIAGFMVVESLRLPDLEILFECASGQLWFEIAGMGGGFRLWRDTTTTHETAIIAESWSRFSNGSEMRHRITGDECRMMPWA